MIVTVLINAVALWLGAKLLRGVDVDDFLRALLVGAALGFLNWTLGGFLDWITLGAITIIVNAAVLMIVDYFMKGLKIKNFWWALALAIIVAVVNTVLRFVF